MIYDFKIRQIVTDNKGELKPATKEYLVDREFFSEVEQEAMKIEGSKEVLSIARIIGSSEIINEKENETDACYKATVVSCYQVDGKESKVKYTMFCWAGDIDEASARLKEYLKQGYDMRLEALKETKIVDVIG